MAYKTNATRRTDGGYDLSYGKGKGKLLAVATLDETSHRWGCDSIGESHKLFRDLKAAWGAWAASVYGGTSASETPQGDNDQTATTQLDAPPAPHVTLVPAETKVCEGMDGVTREIVYSTEGSVISRREINVQQAQVTRPAAPPLARPLHRPNRPAASGQAEAPAAEHPAAVHGSIPPVPRRPRPVPAVQPEPVRGGEEPAA